jgi:hypothetical protein
MVRHPAVVACPSSGHSVEQFLALHKKFFAVRVKGTSRPPSFNINANGNISALSIR